jgi:hypothetical protein
MDRTSLLATGLLLALSAAAQNTCSTALPIGPGIHVVAAVDGTELATPLCAPNGTEGVSATEWYSYTADADTIIHLTTDVQGQAQVNTRFHVYTGACGSLTCVVGNDDGGLNNTSRASFAVEEGSTYLIAFDDRWTAEGFSFEVGQASYPLLLTETFVNFAASFVNMSAVPLAIVDMNNDGLDDIVGVTQDYINIQRQLVGGGFDPLIYQTSYADYPASWSLCIGDLDGNGYNDLLYGGGYGVTFMMAVDGGEAFVERSGPEYVFSQRSNMVDINNDGHLDAFVCHDVAPNVYYMNDGNGNLQFTQGGLGNSCGNYGSIWTDYDNDGDMDCFVAKCGCDPVDLLMRNEGNGSFSQLGPALGFADGHQSWSSAWGDLDNDGDMDAVIGSSSSGIHKLMRNNGDGTFTNATAGSGLDGFFMQGIEWVTHDFNNDGLLDILGAGSLLINRGGLTFSANTFSPGPGAVGDVNNDGALDVMGQYGLQVNQGNGNNWLRLDLRGTVSNRNGIGARITLTTALGTQIREIRAGDGFKYMSSLMAHFGLGAEEEVTGLTIRWPSGIIQEVGEVEVNSVVTVIEPLPTDVGPSMDERGPLVYPDPAVDELFIDLPDTAEERLVDVFDHAGKHVLSVRMTNGRMDIGALSAGPYVLRITVDGTTHEARFTKQ